jgi:hypothetical protein
MLALSMPLAAQQWGHPHPPRAGACFYHDPNFGGGYFCMKAGDRYARMPQTFNDSITSIQVFGGAQVRIFNDPNFTGINALADRPINDLRQWRLPQNPSKSWNDRISSIAVFKPGHDQWYRP